MIKSPCIAVCILEEDDSGEDYCIGCFRMVKEIQDWYDYTDEERAKIMSELPEREKLLP